MEKQTFNIIALNHENIDSEHICCAIGDDKKNYERALCKKKWLKARFDEGHVFKKIDIRGKAFIEYVPAEKAWFPVIAPDYTFIQCFWISGQYKGKGLSKILLSECERDSAGKNGLVALTTNKKLPFLTDKSFYLKQGFEVCDTAVPYFELMVKKFKKDKTLPHFTERAKTGTIENGNGLVFYYSDLCPFTNHLEVMIKVAQERLIPCEDVKIESLKQAKDLPSPFGIFSVFLNGKFLTHELMPEKKFNLLLNKYL